MKDMKRVFQAKRGSPDLNNNESQAKHGRISGRGNTKALRLGKSECFCPRCKDTPVCEAVRGGWK